MTLPGVLSRIFCISALIVSATSVFVNTGRWPYCCASRLSALAAEAFSHGEHIFAPRVLVAALLRGACSTAACHISFCASNGCRFSKQSMQHACVLVCVHLETLSHPLGPQPVSLLEPLALKNHCAVLQSHASAGGLCESVQLPWHRHAQHASASPGGRQAGCSLTSGPAAILDP